MKAHHVLSIACVMLLAALPLAAQTTEDYYTEDTPGVPNCTDGVDNDGDGLTDLDDSSCHEALCQDGLDNDGDGVTDGADTDCQCLSDITGYASNACTANDTKFVLVGLGTQGDGCINENDTVSIRFRAQVRTTAVTRYDLGMWIALDGGDAFNVDPATTGVCGRQILRPSEDSATYNFGTCTAGYGDCTTMDGDGPYREVETVTQADRCAEVIKEDWIAPQNELPAAVFDFLVPPANELTGTWTEMYFDVPCTSADPTTGFLSLGTCASWDNSSGSDCYNFTQALPNNTSKCRCEYVASDVPVGNIDLLNGCAIEIAPPGGILDPTETVTNSVTYSNTVVAGTPPADVCPSTPDATKDERFQCATASYIRFVIDYNESRGQIVGTPTVTDEGGSPVTGDVVYNDTTNGRLIWTPQNPNTSYGTGMGIIGPFTGSRKLTYTYQLTSTSPPADDLTFSAIPYWSDTLPASPYSDLTGAVPQSDPGCTGCFCNSVVSTTPVTLASFVAHRDGKDVRFDWTTATEAGSVGFDLYGKTADGWVQLNDELIPTEAGDSVSPRHYAATFEVPEGIEEFAIEEKDLFGRASRKGPFALGEPAGRVIEPPSVPWQDIRAGHRELAAERIETRLATARRTSGALDQGTASAASDDIFDRRSGTPAELVVTENGLYRVTSEDLLAAGFDLSSVPVDQINLTNRGATVPIHVHGVGSGDGENGRDVTFGPGSYLEFYGEAAATIYTRANVYRLHVDATTPHRVGVDRGMPSPGARPVTMHLASRTFEENTRYSLISPLADPWFDTRMVVTTTPKEFRFQFDAEGYVENEVTPSLDILVYGASTLAADPDHHISVSLNGRSLGEHHFDGLVAYPIRAPLPWGLLQATGNELVIRLEADLGTIFDVVNLEKFEVSYPRSLEATDGRLTFDGSGQRFDLTGFATTDVVAYREGTSGLTRLERVTYRRSRTGAQVSIRGDNRPARYHVADATALLTPGIRPTRPVTDITSGSADYLMIAHPDFIGQLQPLIDLRESRGLEVRVIDVEDIYAQFGYGIFGPEAIRAYLYQAVPAMGVQYILLVGGDTTDYLDYLGTGAMSFIPSIYTATGDIARFAPTDPAYADLDRNGTPDVAIGRLPARSQDEMRQVLDKIFAYEAKGYARTAIFTADTADPMANVPFTAASNAMIGELPEGWDVDTAYLDKMSVDAARTKLMQTIDDGVALVSFVGHSGSVNWTFQDLFDTADAAALVNFDEPAIFTQWGCWNAYYPSATKESLANVLLLSDNRGAAAVLGSTTLTDDTSENLLGAALAPRIAVPGKTLGQAILEAKAAVEQSHPGLVDIQLGWTLLGDPAMALEP